MCTLKEFKDKALSTENTFLLNDERAKILCIKVPIGQAIYIYTMREYLDEKDLVTDIHDDLEMTAILKDKVLYIKRSYNVMENLREEYPEGVYKLDDYLNIVNSTIKEKVFDKLFAELPIKSLSEDDEQACKNYAKDILIFKKDLGEYLYKKQMACIEKINGQKFADYLCGIVDLEEDMRKDFEDKKQKLITLKSSIERIKEIVTQRPEIVLKDYEMNIIDGLHSVDAKAVNVEFIYNGKTATGKVEPDIILRIICNNDYFSDFNFISMKSGEKIIKELGAARGRADGKEVLTCKHINKITYGKRVLYQRNETE